MSRKKKAVEKDGIYDRDMNGNLIEKPEVRLRPGHHTGAAGKYGTSGNGYTLLADGSYVLAPGDQQDFVSIMTEIGAIHSLLNAVTDHAMDRLKALEHRRLAWFKDVVHLVYRDEDWNRATYESARGMLSFKPASDQPPAQEGKTV